MYPRRVRRCSRSSLLGTVLRKSIQVMPCRALSSTVAISTNLYKIYLLVFVVSVRKKKKGVETLRAGCPPLPSLLPPPGYFPSLVLLRSCPLLPFLANSSFEHNSKISLFRKPFCYVEIPLLTSAFHIVANPTRCGHM